MIYVFLHQSHKYYKVFQQMKKSIQPLLILFTTGLICRLFGPISFDLTNIIVIISLSVYLFTTIPINKKNFFPTLILFALILTFPYIDGAVFQLSFLCLFLFLLTLYPGKQETTKENPVPTLITTVIFFIIMFLYLYSSEGWYITQELGKQYSALCSKIYSKTLNLNPTAFGLFIILSFLIYNTVLLALEKNRKYSAFILAVIYIAVISFSFTGINLLIASLIKKNSLPIFSHTLHTQIVLFILLIPSVFFRKKRKFRDTTFIPNKRICVPAVVFICIFTAGIYFQTKPFTPSKAVKDKTVLFFKHGTLDWNIAKFGNYGQRSGGMFGIMPRHLKKMGFKTLMINTITPSVLKNADTLVMINLNKKFRKKELFIIWNFVKNGGSLLLLGDHTDLGGLMKNFNRVLGPVNLKFKFDSAMPSRYTWDFLTETRPHPTTTGFENIAGRTWWVGASLNCLPPARPIIIGRYCYSDWGYKNNAKQAYLGNRRFDYYEPLNDQVLAAVVPYGKGKIMAYGDTSPFHNTTFMNAHKYIVNVFNYLTETEEKNPLSEKILLGIILISVISLIILCFINTPNTLIHVSIVLSLSAVLYAARTEEINGQIKDFPFDKYRVAYLDHSHIGRFDLMSWEDDSIGGLKNNLSRNGYFPLLLNNFDPDKINRAKLLVFIAPTRPFTTDEATVLKNYVKNGGEILLTVGFEEKEASMPLLQAFDLDIENIPLAWCSYKYRKNTTVQFKEAWPISYNRKNNIEVICTPLDYPVVVKQKHGNGSITVIGDSYFLLNINLEGSKKYSISNILLLKNILNEPSTGEINK